MTLTTVGYGDLSPATPGGRATAVVLMVTSCGVVSFITANIAAFFIEDDKEDDLSHEVRSLHQRLDHIEELLTDRSARPAEESQGDRRRYGKCKQAVATRVSRLAGHSRPAGRVSSHPPGGPGRDTSGIVPRRLID